MQPQNPPKTFNTEAMLGPQPFAIKTYKDQNPAYKDLEPTFTQASMSSAQVKHDQDIKLVPFGNMYDPKVSVSIDKEQDRTKISPDIMNQEKYRFRYGYMGPNTSMEHNHPWLYKGYSNPEQAENTPASIGSSISPNSTYGYTGWIRENFDYARYLTQPTPAPK